MITLKPCGRCEQELSLAHFDHPDDLFCKHCTQEVSNIIEKKYSAIEAALFRAKLRRKTKDLKARARAKTG